MPSHAAVVQFNEAVFRRDEDVLKRKDDLLRLERLGTGAVMREDITSSSFLAIIVVGLIVVCAGFIALGI